MADDDIKKLGSAVEQFAAVQKEQATMEKGGFAAFAKSEARCRSLFRGRNY